VRHNFRRSKPHSLCGDGALPGRPFAGLRVRAGSWWARECATSAGGSVGLQSLRHNRRHATRAARVGVRELAPAVCRMGLPRRAPRTCHVRRGSRRRSKPYSLYGDGALPGRLFAGLRVRAGSRWTRECATSTGGSLRLQSRCDNRRHATRAERVGVRELAPAVCRLGLPRRAPRTRHVHRSSRRRSKPYSLCPDGALPRRLFAGLRISAGSWWTRECATSTGGSVGLQAREKAC